MKTIVSGSVNGTLVRLPAFSETQIWIAVNELTRRGAKNITTREAHSGE